MPVPEYGGIQRMSQPEGPDPGFNTKKTFLVPASFLVPPLSWGVRERSKRLYGTLETYSVHFQTMPLGLSYAPKTSLTACALRFAIGIAG